MHTTSLQLSTHEASDVIESSTIRGYWGPGQNLDHIEIKCEIHEDMQDIANNARFPIPHVIRTSAQHIACEVLTLQYIV